MVYKHPTCIPHVYLQCASYTMYLIYSTGHAPLTNDWSWTSTPLLFVLDMAMQTAILFLLANNVDLLMNLL